LKTTIKQQFRYCVVWLVAVAASFDPKALPYSLCCSVGTMENLNNKLKYLEDVIGQGKMLGRCFPSSLHGRVAKETTINQMWDKLIGIIVNMFYIRMGNYVEKKILHKI